MGYIWMDLANNNNKNVKIYFYLNIIRATYLVWTRENYHWVEYVQFELSTWSGAKLFCLDLFSRRHIEMPTPDCHRPDGIGHLIFITCRNFFFLNQWQILSWKISFRRTYQCEWYRVSHWPHENPVDWKRHIQSTQQPNDAVSNASSIYFQFWNLNTFTSQFTINLFEKTWGNAAKKKWTNFCAKKKKK